MANVAPITEDASDRWWVLVVVGLLLTAEALVLTVGIAWFG